MVFSTNQENKARVTVYTTPTCPDCRALKSWFDREGIRFEDRDLTDPDITAEAQDRYGVRVAPITVIGDWFTYGTFAKQKPEIEAALRERA